MIRILLATGLILGAGGALAQGYPSYGNSAASAARTLGATASPGLAYGYVRPLPRADVATTGSIVPHTGRRTVPAEDVVRAH